MKLSILYTIAFSIFLIHPGRAQDFENTIRLADNYLESGQVEEALYTYQRATFYSGDGPNAGLLLKIAFCFSISGDFERSLEYYDHAYYSEPNDSARAEIIFFKAAALIKSGNCHFALIDLLGLDPGTNKMLERRKALYLASAYYRLGDFINSEKYFLSAIPENEISSVNQIESVFRKNSNFNRPNPGLAMWLSVFIPGAGQFYSGDLAAGINSLLLTGSLIGLTFYLTKMYHPIDAILTALPWFQRYYQGGFDQAEKIAASRRQRNRDLAYLKILDIIAAANK